METIIIIAVIVIICILLFKKKARGDNSPGGAVSSTADSPSAAPEADNQDGTSAVGTFPTYVDAIEDDMLICSARAKEIVDQQPFAWEYLLFAQALQDDMKYLSAFRRQTSDNPFVKKIGMDSEGEPYIQYLGSMLSNILLETERFSSKFGIYTRRFNEALGEPGEDGDADELLETAANFMDPYIVYLAFYNDLCTMYSPSGAEKVHDGMKKYLESLLNSMESFYNSICRRIHWMVENPEEAEKEGFNLNFDLKVDENIVQELHENMDKYADGLREARIHRISF